MKKMAFTSLNGIVTRLLNARYALLPLALRLLSLLLLGRLSRP